MYLHLNIHNSSTRSHPSKEENRTNENPGLQIEHFAIINKLDVIHVNKLNYVVLGGKEGALDLTDWHAYKSVSGAYEITAVDAKLDGLVFLNMDIDGIVYLQVSVNRVQAQVVQSKISPNIPCMGARASSSCPHFYHRKLWHPG
jgi:hypothetical protein